MPWVQQFDEIGRKEMRDTVTPVAFDDQELTIQCSVAEAVFGCLAPKVSHVTSRRTLA
jgi:hypothetical protein